MWQKPIQQVPECSACGTPMKLIPAGVSKSTGNPYQAFWSCPNNRSCGGKTIRYTEPTPQAPQKPYYKPTEADIPVVKESPKDAIIADLLNEINGKLDIILKEIIPEQQ